MLKTFGKAETVWFETFTNKQKIPFQEMLAFLQPYEPSDYKIDYALWNILHK